MGKVFEQILTWHSCDPEAVENGERQKVQKGFESLERNTLLCPSLMTHNMTSCAPPSQSTGKVTMVPITHSWSKESVSVPTLTSRGRKLIACVSIHLQGKESHSQEARL